MVAFSSHLRIWGKGSTIRSPPALFFSFFLKVKISWHTPLPFFRPGSIHSSSVSWDAATECSLKRKKRKKRKRLLHYYYNNWIIMIIITFFYIIIVTFRLRSPALSRNQHKSCNTNDDDDNNNNWKVQIGSKCCSAGSFFCFSPLAA